MVPQVLNHADRCITAQVYNHYSYAKEIEVALEMLAGKVREELPADSAQGVVVLAEYKEEKDGSCSERLTRDLHCLFCSKNIRSYIFLLSSLAKPALSTITYIH
jgi:hypothetical protein